MSRGPPRTEIKERQGQSAATRYTLGQRHQTALSFQGQLSDSCAGGGSGTSPPGLPSVKVQEVPGGDGIR
jgi:hypothetical protein